MSIFGETVEVGLGWSRWRRYVRNGSGVDRADGER